MLSSRVLRPTRLSHARENVHRLTNVRPRTPIPIAKAPRHGLLRFHTHAHGNCPCETQSGREEPRVRNHLSGTIVGIIALALAGCGRSSDSSGGYSTSQAARAAQGATGK